MFAFSLFFPAFIVFLATNGDAKAFMISDSSAPDWLLIPELFVFAIGPGLLFLIPAFAHKRLVWDTTSEQANRVIAYWLAVGAALSGGVYALMLHFGKGPLAHDRLGPLMAGILFAVVLLVPAYRSVIEACWQRGVLGLVDLGQLGAVWRDAVKKWQAADAYDQGRSAPSLPPDTGTTKRPDTEEGAGPAQMAPIATRTSVRRDGRAARDHPEELRDVAPPRTHGS
jgi:hypothetical protein